MHVRTSVAALIAARAKAPLAAAMLCLAAAAPAAAQVADGQALCYSRAFSADYLNDPRNSGLLLAELMVVIDARHRDGVPGTRVALRGMAREQWGTYFANDGSCDWDAGAGQYECWTACDSGGFSFALNDDGTASLVNGGRGFGLSGCGEENELFVPSDDAHAAFQLYPLPAEACPADFLETFDFQ
jgi:hypothetical protein